MSIVPMKSDSPAVVCNEQRTSILAAFMICLGGLLSPAVHGTDYTTEIKPLFKARCYRCHAGEQPKSGFRLDTGQSAVRGGQRGSAIVPGDPSASLLVQALRGTHSQLSQMPYRDTPLSEAEIQLVESWIAEGATSPADEVPERHVHWAFEKPSRPAVPPAIPAMKPTNEIDRFIQDRIQKARLAPAPKAAPETLLRRLYLDMIGILPTPDETDAYVHDYAINATERVIDQLLHSPHFGERWGRHWLDVARYADSNGYSIDSPRSIWRYRDYVVDAINRNLPFDQFVTEQLAGDLLPAPTTDQLIATGFHRNTQINQEGGIDREQFRIESVVDRVATTGTAFLGLTIACAQCHDHKFDPFTQSEYYRFFAFFNNQDEPNLETPQPGELAARRQHDEALKQLTAAIQESESEIQARIFDWEKFLSEEDLRELPQTYRVILTKPRELRSIDESQKLFEHFRQENEAYQSLKQQQRSLARKRPRITTTMILREREAKRPTHIHIKGDFTRKGDEVSPGTPATLNPLPTMDNPDRLDFAAWLTSAENPLLARVTVNRIWQQYFGRGIVETENDFGTQGAPPSHPELLDWLAVELIESDWNIKALHKKILMSTTYQQSSVTTSYASQQDPNNLLLARQTRMRLESEIVRDVALAASGKLVTQMGGPSAHPPQPEGVMGLGQVQRQWTADRGEDRYRRGLYTFFFRATPHPALAVFDSPDAFSACSRRIRSNTPLQALTLLNDPAFFELASAFGDRIERLDCQTDSERIRLAFRLATARTPNRRETRLIQQSLDTLSEPNSTDRWFNLARILLNLDETITRE